MNWIVNDLDEMKQRQSDILRLIEEKTMLIDKLKFEVKALNFLYNEFEYEVNEWEKDEEVA